MAFALSYVDPFPIGLSMQVTILMRFGERSGTPPRQYYKCSFLPYRRSTSPASIVLAWHFFQSPMCRNTGGGESYLMRCLSSHCSLMS